MSLQRFTPGWMAPKPRKARTYTETICKIGMNRRFRPVQHCTLMAVSPIVSALCKLCEDLQSGKLYFGGI